MKLNECKQKAASIFPWVLFMAAMVFSACSLQRKIEQPPAFRTHESGIEYRITSEGEGPTAAINDVVKVHYTLMLEDSTVVDNSYDRGEPVSFKLGAGQVIKGWDIAMTLLAKGDEATIKIPPELGYGDKPMGNIPANATLVFKVKIVNIIPAPKPFEIDENISFKETSTGLRYAIVKNGKGTKLEPGMKVKVHYTGFFEDMSMFDSSLEREQPIEITLGRGMVIKGWEEGLSYLRVGDKARIWIPYQLAYGEQGRGPIPPESNLIFDVEVLDATPIKSAQPFSATQKDTLSTDSGLKYIIVEGGRGVYPADGDIVIVHYSGYLTDGTMFDSSVERDQPFRFVIGQGQVIPGWDEGVALMRENAKYRFIIPAELAYGEKGAGPIPPGATLIFDVELLEIE